MRTPSPRHAILVLSAALAAPAAAESIAAPQASFGAPYQVIQDATAAPVVAGNVLRVPVRYLGGCGPHQFGQVSRRQTMGPIVWFVHSTADRCTAPQSQWLSVPITADMRAMGVVWLFAPGNVHLQIRVP